MAQLSWNEIQDRATEFASKWNGETYEKGESQSFWSDFLNVYGIDRRRHGAFFEYAIKKGSGKQGFIDMFWPGKLLAEQKSGGKDLGKAGVQAYEYLETMPDHDLPQAIVVSDFATFQMTDLATREKVEFSLQDLPKHVKLFGFLINTESKHLAEENPVNRKAAEAMAKLHNQLRDDNYTGHDLEVLLVRLVFCMFADDSGIFDHDILRDYLVNRTSEDGSDLGPRLMQIFQAINMPKDQRQTSLDETIASLPYVNGGLFAEPIRTPYFNGDMRADLLKTMELDWSKVSPAIFGSMFQGVMDEKQRRNLGAHYTSEKNILRVIKPLFLDDLYNEFAAAVASGPRKKFAELQKFHDKLAGLKFLDPACGAGNFLVITYRELRRLEHKVLAILDKGEQSIDWLASSEEHGRIKVNVDQMYGIEIEEFPSLIARTALWLTDHQMNMEFSSASGKTFKRLPLTASATIVNDNALTTDWAKVVAPRELDYILGNPPFVGSKMMTPQMRNELEAQFGGYKGVGVLDFVSAWYAKATAFMKQNPKVQTALVSTNSIIQGQQAVILWKYLFNQGVKINFAHRTFKWTNDASGVAAVHCVVIGFALSDRQNKRLFDYDNAKDEPIEVKTPYINQYLALPSTQTIHPESVPSEEKFGEPVIIQSRSKPICDVPEIGIGNKPIDGGNYLFTIEEKEEFIKKEPRAEKLFYEWVGAKEFINRYHRWVLLLKGVAPDELRSMPLVMERVNTVREFRLASSSASTRALANYPTKFHVENIPDENYILIPKVSSEKRNYIPISGPLDPHIIASDLVFIMPGGKMYHFGILTSQMHMAWMRAVAGRLKSDYRYSKDIVYNNFIWPEATDTQKAEIEKLAQIVLDTRAEFQNSSLADLYDKAAMPDQLREAHQTLDRVVDKLYQNEPFATDAERVAQLLIKYEELSHAR